MVAAGRDVHTNSEGGVAERDAAKPRFCGDSTTFRPLLVGSRDCPRRSVRGDERGCDERGDDDEEEMDLRKNADQKKNRTEDKRTFLSPSKNTTAVSSISIILLRDSLSLSASGPELKAISVIECKLHHLKSLMSGEEGAKERCGNVMSGKKQAATGRAAWK